MMKQIINHPMYTLFLSFIFMTACSGQVKHPPSESDKEIKTIPIDQPKLIKTQGTNQYANTQCGLQDREGNLWFGTTGEGVYRFDGKDFMQFTVEDGLSSNHIWSILEDASGNIWFGTRDGLSRFDGKKMIAVPIPFTIRPVLTNNDYYTEWSTKNTVWSMLQDKSGIIWFGTGDGVYFYDGNKFTRFLDNDGVVNKEGLHLKMVSGIIEDKKGNIWFASGMLPGQEGLCRYDGYSITRFNPGGEGWIRYVLEDKNGIIWAATRNKGNWRYDGKTFTRFEDILGIGSAQFIDPEGNIWFSGEENTDGYGSKGGVWRYDGKSLKNFTSRDGIGNYSVWAIVEDRSGNLWFGTRNIGLYKFDGEMFTSYSE